MASRKQITVTVDESVWNSSIKLAEGLGIPKSRMVDIALVALNERWHRLGRPSFTSQESNVTTEQKKTGT